ncbi:MAG: cardiolipin synthase ClsB [Burkholderiales bacterium]|nr:cardiolipin synthase ClsB [Burkholderiales bacterium]
MIPFIDGNQLTLLQNGAEFFPALEAAIDRASSHVYLESYIYADDATGRRIAAALMRAAQRGVETHLIIDGFGAQDYPASALQALRAAGVDALIYRPQISPWRFRRQRLRRLHRKLAVIDQTVAFVGGINIVNDAVSPDTPPQFDFTVAVEGPLVAPILQEMRKLHAHMLRIRLRLPDTSAAPPAPPPAGKVHAAFIQRTNLKHRRDIERAYLRAIGRARHEIILANSYFLPGRRFRTALMQAAARGVKVVLLLQGRIEFRFVHYATRALYDELLAAGIEIHEYQPSILHAKVAVIDQVWATVGSSNIDPTSLHLSREANVVAFDRAFATTLHASLEAAIQTSSRRMHPTDLARRTWWERLLSRWAYSGVRLLAELVGYGVEMK